MTKCEVIDLTPSDSGSDSDFIKATSHFCTYRICFCIKFLLHQVPIISSSCHNGNYFTGLVCVYVVVLNALQSCEIRQTHLDCEKLGVSLCDANLGESKTIYWLEWKDASSNESNQKKILRSKQVSNIGLKSSPRAIERYAYCLGY